MDFPHDATFYVTASTIDGQQYVIPVGDTVETYYLTDDPRDVEPLGILKAALVQALANQTRRNAKTGEAFDNAPHNVRLVWLDDKASDELAQACAYADEADAYYDQLEGNA